MKKQLLFVALAAASVLTVEAKTIHDVTLTQLNDALVAGFHNKKSSRADVKHALEDAQRAGGPVSKNAQKMLTDKVRKHFMENPAATEGTVGLTDVEVAHAFDRHMENDPHATFAIVEDAVRQ